MSRRVASRRVALTLPTYCDDVCPCGRVASVVESRAVRRPICKRCAVTGTAGDNREEGTAMRHTYAVHLVITAESDDDARRIAEAVHAGAILQGADPIAAHLTDADDWAEHVPTEDVCGDCGRAGGTERRRDGRGARVCAACQGMPYVIADVVE